MMWPGSSSLAESNVYIKSMYDILRGNNPGCDDFIHRIRKTIDSTELINVGLGRAFDGESFKGAPQDSQGLQGKPEIGKQTEELGQPKNNEVSSGMENPSTDLLEPQMMSVVVSDQQAPDPLCTGYICVGIIAMP